MRIQSLGFSALCLSLVASCATAAVPHERMAASQGAITAAEQMGAEKVPNAALHLQMAKNAAEQAQTLIKKGENKRAAFLLERAEADAELALSLTREAPLRAEAQKAVEQLQAVKQKSSTP